MKINNIDDIEWDYWDWGSDNEIYFYFNDYAVNFENIFFNKYANPPYIGHTLT